MGIKLYNKLPNTIERLDKMQEFKRRLKYFLMQHTSTQWMNVYPNSTTVT